MRYISIRQINKILFWIILLGTVTFAQTEWVGDYEFIENGGETAGGTKIYIIHKLKINNDGNTLTAHLTGIGYMINLNLYADAKIEGETLKLHFTRKEAGNALGFDPKQGDLLLTLEEKVINGKTQILTYWNKYKAGFPDYETSGKVYFKKTKNTAEYSDREIIDLKKSIKDSMLLTYEISQSPYRELTTTRDMQEEAQKYFQALIDRDAQTILALKPPHLINVGVGTDENTVDPVETIKATLDGMSEDTFKYNSVKVGKIIETGILNYDDALKENIFAVIEFHADV